MDFRKFAEETALATFGTKTETKWECPYCGNELKGPVQPNEACCGEAGHAQEVTYKEYPCGCEAGPAAQVPDYCPEHGAQAPNGDGTTAEDDKQFNRQWDVS